MFVSDFLECCGDFSGGYWGYEMQRVRFLRARIGEAVVLLGVGGKNDDGACGGVVC